MNNRTFGLALLLVTFLSGLAFAQTGSDSATQDPPTATLSGDSPWHLLFFEPGDPRVTETVNSIIRGGYIPVGMEVTAGQDLGILMVKSGSYDVESWAILDYTDWNALEGEITAGIRDGFVPMDISRYNETLAVLWVRTNLPIDGWRISTSPNTLSDRTRTVNDFQQQGFSLWGLSVHENLAWYLFLRQRGMPPAGAISAFSKAGDSLQRGLLDASRDGWLPNGLASNDNTFYICFVK